MNSWNVQDAKSRLSELLDACVSEGPQLLTRRGVDTAVLVPIAEWQRLTNAARPSLKSLLLSEADRFELDVSPRGPAYRGPAPRRRVAEI